MPNHIENIITLKGDKQQIDAMLNKIKSDEYGAGTIDFNKIIPMPESLNIEAGSRTDKGLKLYKEFIGECLLDRKETDVLKVTEKALAEAEKAFLNRRTDVKPDEWKLGKAAWNNIQKYGAPTWYEWCINNWGTKWNAYGYDKNSDYSSEKSLRFQTAWSAPQPVIERLSAMYPDVTFEQEFADEDLGANCGRKCYRNGECTESYYPESLKDGIEFACRVWDYDPADLDFALNKTGTEYINVEVEEYELIELFGKPALFTNERLSDEDIPKGLFCYQLREGDDGRFSSIERKVAVNHGGSVITDEPIEFDKRGFIIFAEATEPNFTGENITLGKYMRGEFEQDEDEELQFGGMHL